MAFLGIPNNLIRLTRSTMEDSTYNVMIGTNMTDDFKVGNGLKQTDGLAPSLFSIAVEYVIRHLSVKSNQQYFKNQCI